MKTILIVGNWKWGFYEEALGCGFAAHGWQVERFTVDGGDESSFSLRHPVRHRRELKTLNRDLIECVGRLRPDALFFYRGTVFRPDTIRKIKQLLPSAAIIFYHNDNPFLHNLRCFFRYLFFRRNLRLADLVYVYRPSNLEAAAKYNSSVHLLMPYCYSKTDLIDPASMLDSKKNSLVYIGHYEADGREALLDELFRNGIRIHIFGPQWEAVFRRNHWPMEFCHPPVYDRDEYRRILNSSWFCLALLSHRNRDVYTRRCFEIPACGSIMLAPYSKELDRIFPADEAAVYYRSPAELREKIAAMLKDPEQLKEITRNGRRIVGNHTESERAAQIIADMEHCK